MIHTPQKEKSTVVSPVSIREGRGLETGSLRVALGAEQLHPWPQPLPTLPGFFSVDLPELRVGIKMCSSLGLLPEDVISSGKLSASSIQAALVLGTTAASAASAWSTALRPRPAPAAGSVMASVAQLPCSHHESQVSVACTSHASAEVTLASSGCLSPGQRSGTCHPAHIWLAEQVLGQACPVGLGASLPQGDAEFVPECTADPLT